MPGVHFGSAEVLYAGLNMGRLMVPQLKIFLICNLLHFWENWSLALYFQGVNWHSFYMQTVSYKLC